MLVGIGAATFALVTLQMIETFAHRPDTIRMDPIRLIEAAYVPAGVAAVGHFPINDPEIEVYRRREDQHVVP
ncbi:hypothetical protein CNY89_24550, partial [Amaricoccus sp. HAR-UPW-R2A-40]